MPFSKDVLFANDDKAGRHSLILVSGFYTGIPLAVCETEKSSGWSQIRKELEDLFSKPSSAFEPAYIEYDQETDFPLGDPLLIRYRLFFEVVDVRQYLQDLGFTVSTTALNLDHLIWICPSGVVLVLAQVSFDPGLLLTLDKFEALVEQHYAELSYIFVQVAAVLFPQFSPVWLQSSLCSQADVEKITHAFSYVTKFAEHARGDPSRPGRIGSGLDKDDQAASLFNDILRDVYYIDFTEGMDVHREIGYKDATLIAPDRSELHILAIAFSSFVAFLSLQQQLSQDLQSLQEELIGMSAYRKEVYAQLKLFRIFASQLINESSPIHIHLKAPYMMWLEEFWEAERTEPLVSHINDQLAILGEMFDWIEQIRNETLMFKLTLAGTVLGLLSIAAVVGGLLSAFDPDLKLFDLNGRIALVVAGLVAGILLLVLIYKINLSDWVPQFQVVRGKSPRRGRS